MTSFSISTTCGSHSSDLSVRSHTKRSHGSIQNPSDSAKKRAKIDVVVAKEVSAGDVIRATAVSPRIVKPPEPLTLSFGSGSSSSAPSPKSSASSSFKRTIMATPRAKQALQPEHSGPSTLAKVSVALSAAPQEKTKPDLSAEILELQRREKESDKKIGELYNTIKMTLQKDNELISHLTLNVLKYQAAYIPLQMKLNTLDSSKKVEIQNLNQQISTLKENEIQSKNSLCALEKAHKSVVDDLNAKLLEASASEKSLQSQYKAMEVEFAKVQSQNADLLKKVKELEYFDVATPRIGKIDPDSSPRYFGAGSGIGALSGLISPRSCETPTSFDT